jgi:effector-binding domain-containing protein
MARQRYTFTIVELQPQPMLYIRRTCTADDVADCLTDDMIRLEGYVLTSGVTSSGNAMARYLTIDPEAIEYDVMMPLTQSAQGEGDIQAGTLNGGLVAMTAHTTDPENIMDAYMAFDEWILTQPYQPSDAPWEDYNSLSDDESPQHQTMIYFPLEDAEIYDEDAEDGINAL